MEMFAEQIVSMYLRTQLSLFSAKDFERNLRKMGIKASINECEFFLETNAEVFALTNGMYVTRAGIFTDKFFCIKPTKKELAKKIFVAGHRCMPFADSEELGCFLHFYYKGKELPRKVVEFDSVTAESFFFLFGEEFSPQFIMADPANEGLAIVDAESVLPPAVNLTAVDISAIVDECGFKNGDRLLCRVVDWDSNIIEIEPLVREPAAAGMQMRQEDVERQKWFGDFEDAMEASFERVGPCSSIEEQLALVVLENFQELCTRSCASVEECILRSNKIGLEQYGIETRIWRRGQDVPAIGAWNNFDAAQGEEIEYGDFFVADFLIDAFVKNELAQKRFDMNAITSCVVPKDFVLSEKEMRKLQERVSARYGVVKKTYNSFADFSLVPIRQQALELYEKVATLIFKIDSAKAELEDYPQQELVTVSQIYRHVMQIIDHMEYNPEGALEESDELFMSLDGMSYNYDCIYNQLVDIINKSSKKKF